MDILRQISVKEIREDIPDFKPGDTIRVQSKIVEGDKERIQQFEGVVIRRRGEGIKKTFTVRKLSSGIGVERIFQLHSPLIKTIEVVKKGGVRKAKLYYLRGKKSKKMRLKTVVGQMTSSATKKEEVTPPPEETELEETYSDESTPENS